jgi:hypothetical protein
VVTPDLPASGLAVSFTSSAREQARAAARIFQLSWAWWLAMIPFCALPLGVAAYWFARAGWHPQVVRMAGLGLLGGVAWHFVMPWIGVLAARSSVPDMNAPQTWTLQTEGLSIATSSTTITRSWPSIVRVRETGEFFLFYVSGSAAHFLPKRSLTAEQQGALRAAVVRPRVTSGVE